MHYVEGVTSYYMVLYIGDGGEGGGGGGMLVERPYTFKVYLFLTNRMRLS